MALESTQTSLLSPELEAVTRELGYHTLTPVQRRCIPVILAGRDLVAQSKTGSGKTAAFALPMIEQLMKDVAPKRPGERPSLHGLVLCPTRELCTQVAREIRKVGRRLSGLQVLILSGGQPGGPQRASLEKGVHVVVGTPGRVLDHLNRQSLDVSRVRTLVLDEADRMLDMGFQVDMEKILVALPAERQTVFFSATYPASIVKLSRRYQKDPERVIIEDPEGGGAPTEIVQRAYLVAPPAEGLREDAKVKALRAVLEEIRPNSAMIFCNLKQTVADLARDMASAGVSVAGLSGDLEQSARDRVMAKFRNQSTRVLVATDVASRGIDVEALDLVVNFDLPHEPEIYVHRVGRTGRAGQSGLAVSLYFSSEERRLKQIERFTNKPIERLAAATPAPTVKPELVKGAVLAKPLAMPTAAMETLYISGGRKEKMRPGDILGALTGEAGGLPAAQVGKIEIHDHFSYVAVSREVARIALARLRNGRIKGRKFKIEPVR
ncbi:MAG: ATP-dependent RNA helicase DbpA [Bacteriovoracia bacterium]